ncbi:MAG: hypothetical protein CME63_16570 [Halobacteriovoraceae bacterium]|jgi:hypothetical protein|nr:hypothetical protein [Halobacteriovoraceae bacterium]MBC99359.1 hypothetical protein [Halobacteriovoraceae bacterium]|tara:strand:- start:118154 stop:118501 length:348 start_codon:yes stop_codon:yes gene_type:complete
MKLFPSSLLLALLIFTSCSSQSEKDESKNFQVDQAIADGNGEINFARAHYVEAKTDAMNRVLDKKMRAHIREFCEERKLNKKILRIYDSQTDFVTLRYDYKYNRKVKVYEFQCVR